MKRHLSLSPLTIRPGNNATDPTLIRKQEQDLRGLMSFPLSLPLFPRHDSPIGNPGFGSASNLVPFLRKFYR